MISLLVFPGHDEADERIILEEFVMPMVASTLNAMPPSTPGP
jgi:hypothetical protein